MRQAASSTDKQAIAARPPLRVVLVSSSSGSRGGGEFYLCGLANGLAALGHEVHSVLAEHRRMDELAEQLAEFGTVHRIRYQNTYDRRFRCVAAVRAHRDIERLAGNLAALRPDVIHVNKQNLEDALDLLGAAQRTGIPTVATIHVTRSMRSLRSWGGGIRDWVSGRTLRCIPCPVIAIARSGISDLRALGIDERRLHLVWNGVSAAPAGNRDALRREWGCGPNDVVLGCVARIEPQKNPLFMPKLLAQLPPHVRLVWIGDGSLREALRESASTLGVADRLILPGWQHNARASMSGFDLFVLPSLYEGFPFAILEAMAAGLPCVVSDVDGVGEAVVDGESGYVCPPNATDVWLDRIRRYLADSDQRRQAALRAGARYAENFSLEVMARKTADIYYSLVQSHS
jgi:glycosyltransferase involved in cell wall biosynthesis